MEAKEVVSLAEWEAYAHELEQELLYTEETERIVKAYEDENEEHEQEYVKTCECGNVITIIAQIDSDPEYYTSVKVICHVCIAHVEFIVPVN